MHAEWPLLLYPVLIAAALLLVVVVNRPEASSRSRGGSTRTAKPTGAPVLAQGKPVQAEAGPAVDPNAKARENSAAPEMPNKPPVLSDTSRKLAGGAGKTAPTADAAAPADAGPAVNDPPLIASLRRAVQDNDQAALKKCMDQLVALGDQALPALRDMVARGSDAGAVCAAEALARIGTPAATQSLIEALAQLADSPYKERIARKLSGVNSHESWPLLVDAVQTSADATVRRAASAALSQTADAPIVDELVSRYDAAATIDEAADWASTVANINSPKATESLLTLARQTPAVPEDPLDQAVLSALAKVGDPQCVSYLLTRLEAAQPGETSYLMNLISQINQPRAEPSLLYAAAGNKEVSAELGRTAAIQALRNFPDEQTFVLLEQIAATDRNAIVATAATRTLNAIENAAPRLAANAQVRPGEQILPTLPTQK